MRKRRPAIVSWNILCNMTNTSSWIWIDSGPKIQVCQGGSEGGWILIVGEGRAVRAFARMPILATMRLWQKWGTQTCCCGSNLGHPPPVVSDGFYVWGCPSAGDPLRFYLYGADFSGCVMGEAAPAIVFGVGYETALHRVAVDVLESSRHTSCGLETLKS